MGGASRRAAVLLFALAAACAQAKPVDTKVEPPTEDKAGVFARLETGKGVIVARLWAKTAPAACANFIALAEGGKEWTDPRTGKKTKKPLYGGTRFFKVVPGFLIQGGDPLDSGEGGPGYFLKDELHPGRRFDKAGVLAMASSAADGAGSQFFITLAPAPWLDKKHTIFGEVVSGLEAARAIAAVPRDGRDRPLKPVALLKVTIDREKRNDQDR